VLLFLLFFCLVFVVDRLPPAVSLYKSIIIIKTN
jgi:hypothetical protein